MSSIEDVFFYVFLLDCGSGGHRHPDGGLKISNNHPVCHPNSPGLFFLGGGGWLVTEYHLDLQWHHRLMPIPAAVGLFGVEMETRRRCVNQLLCCKRDDQSLFTPNCPARGRQDGLCMHALVSNRHQASPSPVLAYYAEVVPIG